MKEKLLDSLERELLIHKMHVKQLRKYIFSIKKQMEEDNEAVCSTRRQRIAPDSSGKED